MCKVKLDQEAINFKANLRSLGVWAQQFISVLGLSQKDQIKASLVSWIQT